ncbi:MAG TPA: diaminopimelate epimerase [Oceanospirillales bacterium]|nr:diaminopimelate epimerase [Oceanospirillaceae bacterium]HBS43156.1 diaminopimelate epimerase [Oceanospirillales bacterium]|tara:strand:- start:5825 stop:6664 length:840 start_codon:yes stop_codon:yes gene_type:complete
MWFKFTKMHGLGNDFMMVDLITQTGQIYPETVPALADRRFGIGFDQLLIVERPTRPDVDFRYRILNADGSEVENCGNGARCFARFVFDQHLTGKRHIRVETMAGLMELQLTDERDVIVDMGEPILEPQRIPFNATEFATEYQLELPETGPITLGAVSMGNPHAVLRVEDVDTAPVAEWGPVIERCEAFPRKVNVGFMQIVNEHHIRLRVFERGTGETLACGTGACAAVVSGQLRGWLKPGVTVSLPGGDLRIDWDGQGPVKMTGPATTVYEGRVNIERK